MNATSSSLAPAQSFLHGACLVFLDGLGCGGASHGGRRNARETAEEGIGAILRARGVGCVGVATSCEEGWRHEGDKCGLGPFMIPTGACELLIASNC